MGDGHGLRGTDKRLRNNDHGRHTQFFHNDAVEQTARAARPSVSHPDQDKVTFLRQHLGLIGFYGMGDRGFSDRHHIF